MLRKILLIGGLVMAAFPSSHAQITPRSDVMTGAFEPGFVGEAEFNHYPIRVVRIGEVGISSGRLLLADPFWMSAKDEPLSLVVPPGRYPVDLAVADAGQSGQRVALARLLISDVPAVRWSLAVTADQDPAFLKADEVFGYAVETGTGAFIDAGVPAWFEAEYPSSNAERVEAVHNDWQLRGEAAAEQLGLPFGFTLVEQIGPGGAAMFSSGWGDGEYASWIGYDTNDRPVAIVTDFAVITAVNFPHE